MSSKTQRIISLVLIGIPTFVFSFGGVMKLIGAEPESVVQFLTKVGFGNYILLIGLTELLIAALLLYPKTTKIGFLFASCYFAGAFSLELSGSQPPAAAIILALLWVGMFLKDKEMFLNTSVENK